MQALLVVQPGGGESSAFGCDKPGGGEVVWGGGAGDAGGGAEQGMRVEEPGTLLVLLDAYEVTRDEGMLQRVLDVVGEGLERLPVVVESVKLLAYCYYYVEDGECLSRAEEMIRQLEEEGVPPEELERTAEGLREFAGN